MSTSKPPVAPRKRPKPGPSDEFVERLAMALETDGFPTIAGRIFGLLLITDGDLSLDSITDAVGASKASVSVNTRMLEDKGLIERACIPGDRRDYYRSAPDLFVKTMEQRLIRWDRIRSVVEGASSDSSISPAARARLKEFESQSTAIHEILEVALDRLKTRRRRS
jgi:DNA-binding transcriptional regulator GbsR (MarR family)